MGFEIIVQLKSILILRTLEREVCGYLYTHCDDVRIRGSEQCDVIIIFIFFIFFRFRLLTFLRNTVPFKLKLGQAAELQTFFMRVGISILTA